MTEKADKKQKTVTIAITPELQEWIALFRHSSLETHGFSPSLQQCMVAYMAQSLRKMMPPAPGS